MYCPRALTEGVVEEPMTINSIKYNYASKRYELFQNHDIHQYRFDFMSCWL